MGTLVAVVYGTKSGGLRRIIDTHGDPDDNAISRATNNLKAGESIVTFPRNSFPAGSTPGSFIINRTTIIPAAAVKGVTIVEPIRCVLVPGATSVLAVGNSVTQVLHADPDIDVAPAGMQMIQSDTADTGHIWNGTTFTKVAL